MDVLMAVALLLQDKAAEEAFAKIEESFVKAKSVTLRCTIESCLNEPAQFLVAGAKVRREALEKTLPGPTKPVIGRLPGCPCSASRIPA